jgi:hypothetical protein
MSFVGIAGVQQVADPRDVVIKKQRVANFDTHVGELSNSKLLCG